MPKNKRFSVYWFNPEPAVGAELRKVRPCIVVSPEEMNQVRSTVLIAPMTSTFKSWPFRITVAINGRKSSVACDQIRAVDKSRLGNYIADLAPVDSKTLLQAVQQIFAN